jgi:hypothetical protein
MSGRKIGSETGNAQPVKRADKGVQLLDMTPRFSA